MKHIVLSENEFNFIIDCALSYQGYCEDASWVSNNNKWKQNKRSNGYLEAKKIGAMAIKLRKRLNRKGVKNG